MSTSTRASDATRRKSRREGTTTSLPGSAPSKERSFSKRSRGRSSARHLSPDEVEAIVAARRNKLTAVYDQSFARGRKVDDQLTEKLRDFKERGIHGFAYRSHAHFIFLSRDGNMLRRARGLLIDARMPKYRFTPLT